MSGPSKETPDPSIPSPVLIEKNKPLTLNDSEPSTPITQPRNLVCPGAPRSSRRKTSNSPATTPTRSNSSSSEFHISDEEIEDSYDMCSIDSNQFSSKNFTQNYTLSSKFESELQLSDKEFDSNDDQNMEPEENKLTKDFKDEKEVNESNTSSIQGYFCSDRFGEEIIPSVSFKQLSALHAYKSIPHHCQHCCRRKCEEFFTTRHNIRPEEVENTQQIVEKNDESAKLCKFLNPKSYNYRFSIPTQNELKNNNYILNLSVLPKKPNNFNSPLFFSRSNGESRLQPDKVTLYNYQTARLARRDFRTQRFYPVSLGERVPKKLKDLADLDFFTMEKDNSLAYYKDFWEPPVVKVKEFSKNGVEKTDWESVLKPNADALKKYLEENERLRNEKTLSKEDLEKIMKERCLEAEKKARDLEKKKIMIEKLDDLTEPFFLANMNENTVAKQYDAAISSHLSKGNADKLKILNEHKEKNESKDGLKNRIQKKEDRKGKGITIEKKHLVEKQLYAEDENDYLTEVNILCNIKASVAEQTKVKVVVSEEPYENSEGIQKRISINISFDK
ncbi:uncharacterized protein SAPINGB_P004382 [Magnusiomyces paraingens]|uniref:Uncharacterized protein n=1 Tax=Magnusiomyces paraingens TaxID=2606893 RepID=A0A5E8BU79_9ASCO|nr:uncharacterized protein SAPINGB_P004382 [Saprochaete ingens]VVT55026.1 unnamed protein product [Saprochaete ingens]